MNFGERLRSLREKAGYDSQRSLSVASGVSNATIARIENGDQFPTPATLKKLATPLNRTYEEMMRTAGYLDHETAAVANQKGII
ncbi:helix-turn-helix domain-containing protein [Paenibacillus sp. 276b]|uniref:helix-turn-helix domain-containing protein n=1 Tax=Paenibacillus sp. 276b TaxID=1566277 RepID=UPI000896BFA4|nr:helix-turn-helix transcriptional regulator [Paenibacillus sp. 276b]SEB28065.1 Helix-turn-helix domain-containing protein [Paenibacillus sp. 276b]